MKKERTGEWEACIAESTLPKGWGRSYLEIGRWYPIESFTGQGAYIKMPDGDTCFILLKNCCHLAGGNWKIRRVKKGQNV